MISGSNVTGGTAGTCTTAARQSGNDNYSGATAVGQSFAIALLSVSSPTITANTGSGSGTAKISGSGWIVAPPGYGAMQSGSFIPESGHPKSPQISMPVAKPHPFSKERHLRT